MIDRDLLSSFLKCAVCKPRPFFSDLLHFYRATNFHIIQFTRLLSKTLWPNPARTYEQMRMVITMITMMVRTMNCHVHNKTIAIGKIARHFLCQFAAILS